MNEHGDIICCKKGIYDNFTFGQQTTIRRGVLIHSTLLVCDGIHSASRRISNYSLCMGFVSGVIVSSKSHHAHNSQQSENFKKFYKKF